VSDCIVEPDGALPLIVASTVNVFEDPCGMTTAGVSVSTVGEPELPTPDPVWSPVGAITCSIESNEGALGFIVTELIVKSLENGLDTEKLPAGTVAPGAPVELDALTILTGLDGDGAPIDMLMVLFAELKVAGA
jgi:hypothetical protein